MQRILDPPSNRSCTLVRQREAPRGFLCLDELAVTSREFLAAARPVRSGAWLWIYSSSASFNAASSRTLAHRPPAPIYISGNGRSTVFFHPPNEIGVGGESCATGKDRAQAFLGAPHHFFEKGIHIAVDIAEEREIKRISGSRSTTIDANVIECLVVQDEAIARNEACRIARTGSAGCQRSRARARRSWNRAAGVAPPRALDRSAPGP